MSDNTIVEGNQKTDHNLVEIAPRDQNIRTVISLCALGLMACFFLPWIKLLFADLSGYQLQQLPGDGVKLLWIIPGMALVALITAIANQQVANGSQLAGMMPFVALVYYRFKLGDDFFQALEIGAYVSLGLGAVLFFLPRFLSKPRT